MLTTGWEARPPWGDPAPLTPLSSELPAEGKVGTALQGHLRHHDAGAAWEGEPALQRWHTPRPHPAPSTHPGAGASQEKPQAGDGGGESCSCSTGSVLHLVYTAHGILAVHIPILQMETN